MVVDMRKQTVRTRAKLKNSSLRRKTPAHPASPAKSSRTKRADAFTNLDGRYASEAARYICAAFRWGESREGYHHWEKIHARLCELAGVKPFAHGAPGLPAGKGWLPEDGRKAIPTNEMGAEQPKAASHSLLTRIKAWWRR